MSLESYCAACTYMSESGSYDGKYYCSRKGEDRYANDAKCYSFCEAYSRSNYSRDNMYSNSANHQGSGCYITTAMCNILGFPDNNYYLNALRSFRDNYLKNDPQYYNLLLTYDAVGPMIAYNLSIDKRKEKIAYNLFHNHIRRTVNAIAVNNYEKAINIYEAMTLELATYYHLDINVNFDDKNIDMASLGKARVKKYR